MWQRVLGLSDKTDDSLTSRRKEESRSQRKGPESVVSSSSTRKQSRGDDRDRGINPNSTSYSSSSRSPYPGGAAPSVASSYATAQAHRSDDRVKEPDLIRSSSLADNMPRTRSDRDDRSRDGEKSKKDTRRRERSSSRDRKGHRRNRSRSEERDGKTEKRERKTKRRSTGDFAETSRAGEVERFDAQTGAPGFSQFPGQFESGPSNRPDTSQAPHHLSDHVPDMFPGQFPSGATAPYRPPLAKNEGGPGLASEYYGDVGQSVEDQPGVRIHSPNLIVGAEPHLMMASADAAPPPEPSSIGQEGSAAAFWNTEATFQTPNTSPRPAPQGGSTPHGAPYITQGALSPGLPPQSYSGQSISISPNTSMSAVPTVGVAAAAAGASAGYAMNYQSSSHQISHLDSYQGFALQELHGSALPLPPSSSARPPRPGKQSSSNIPFAAAAAGAAGLAAATYQHHQHQPNNQYHQNSYQHANGSYGSNMAQSHRHEGPFAKLVDFFKDPEGVAQFEEYTEYIGVCRGCFDPSSSPRDAPRKHRYRKRRSAEKLRANTRVDKENRYYMSSDGEGKRRNNKKSWLAATAAGVGLAQVGKSIFGNPNDFQDTHSVKSGRYNESTAPLPRRSSPPGSRRIYAEGESRRREDSSAYQKVHYGVAADGGVVEKGSRRPTENDTVITTYVDRDDREVRKERRRSRSRSRDRNHKFRNAAIGAAAGAAFASAVPRKRTPSPEKKVLRVRHRSQQESPERRPRRARQSPEPSPGIFGGMFSSTSPKRQGSKKRKQKGGLFNFGNCSSSSSDADRGQIGHQRRSVTKRKSSPKIKSDAEAKAALLGLGTAAAALAAHESRSKNKHDRVASLVAVKDTKGKHKHHDDIRHENGRSKSRSDSLKEEDLWESASEDEGYSSVDSALAFGISRHGSRESLTGSGTEKWDWRWGNKKPRRPSRESPTRPHFASAAGVTAAGAAGAVAGAILSGDRYHDSAMQCTGSLPSMKQVYPVSTSDPTSYDVVRHDSAVGQQVLCTRPDPVPIQQPRPIAPVPATVYTQSPTDAPIIAPSQGAKSAYEPQPDQYPGISKYGSMPGAFETADEASKDRKYRRRDSSPPTVVAIDPKSSRSREDNYASRSGSIKDKDEKHRKEIREERRKFDRTFSEMERREREEQEALDREKRRSKLDSRNRDDESGRNYGMDQIDSREPSRRERRSTVSEEDKQSKRHAEIERELRRLAEEEKPAAKPRKATGNHAVKYAIAGAAIGATAAAIARTAKPNEKRWDPRDDREDDNAQIDTVSVDEPSSRQRSSKAKGGFAGFVGAMMDGGKERGRKLENQSIETIEPSSKDPEDYHRQTSAEDRRDQERELARHAAVKVRIARSPSPAPHESYASYFAPDDILSKPADEKQKVVDPTADVKISVESPKSHGGFIPPEIPDIYDPEIAPVDTHRYLAWVVPPLNLIHPTPLPSRANSVAPSPVIQPQDFIEEVEEEKSEASPRKVSFEETHQTHEYEVVTPEDHRDEYIASQPDQKGVPNASDTESPKSPTTPADIQSPVEEIPRRSMPGVFDDDPEFAATLAAGAEAAGFDPEIVIEDPMYRRRNSPPGSQERRDFYQQPFYQTVSDIAMDSPRSRGAPPQRGWVEEGELPETPKEANTQAASEAGSKDSDPDTSRKERRKREKAAKRRDADLGSNEFEVKPEASIERSTSFDPDDAELEIIEDAAQEAPAETDFAPSKSKKAKKKKSKKGIEEDWEDASGDRQTPDGSNGNQSRLGEEETQNALPEAKSAGVPEDEEIYDSPNEYAASAVSAPVEDDRAGKKSKKKKRRSTGFDDAASTVSSPAKFDDSKESTTKSKKRSGLFGLFSKSSEDVSEKSTSKEVPVEQTDDFEMPKKKGKKSRRSRDTDEYYNASESVTDLSRVEEDLESDKSGKRRKADKRRSLQDIKDDEDRGRQSRDLPDKVLILAIP